jgi:hypothetical protein
MISDLLRRGFERNVSIIHAQADGLTHEQSLTQTQYNVNCFNWVVGHIITSRHVLVTSLGAGAPFDDARLAAYQRESEPITADGPGVVPFDDLLSMLDVIQETFDALFGSATDEWLAEETQVAPDRMSPRLSQAMFYLFHDTFHTGQTEMLRQMSGYDDKII